MLQPIMQGRRDGKKSNSRKKMKYDKLDRQEQTIS